MPRALCLGLKRGSPSVQTAAAASTSNSPPAPQLLGPEAMAAPLAEAMVAHDVAELAVGASSLVASPSGKCTASLVEEGWATSLGAGRQRAVGAPTGRQRTRRRAPYRALSQVVCARCFPEQLRARLKDRA